MSDYRPSSDLSRVNTAAGSGEWVEVDASLVEVLTHARDISSRTDGAFDATVGPAVLLWRQSRRDGVLPASSDRERAASLINWERVELASAPPRVRLGVPGMKLDLGGIAKGYAAQHARDLLMRRGHRASLVALAGDIALGDPPPGTEGWRVAMDDAEGDRPIGTILVSNACVSTSGGNAQYIEIEGVRYAHIVDPRTGLGLTSTTPRAPVTVVADSGSVADAMATAAFVLGPGASRSLDLPQSCTILFHTYPDPSTIGASSAAQLRWTPAPAPRHDRPSPR
jgi:thiamine biosynthesis lipoprotein